MGVLNCWWWWGCSCCWCRFGFNYRRNCACSPNKCRRTHVRVRQDEAFSSRGSLFQTQSFCCDWQTLNLESAAPDSYVRSLRATFQFGWCCFLPPISRNTAWPPPPFGGAVSHAPVGCCCFPHCGWRCFLLLVFTRFFCGNHENKNTSNDNGKDHHETWYFSKKIEILNTIKISKKEVFFCVWLSFLVFCFF